MLEHLRIKSINVSCIHLFKPYQHENVTSTMRTWKYKISKNTKTKITYLAIFDKNMK